MGGGLPVLAEGDDAHIASTKLAQTPRPAGPPDRFGSSCQKAQPSYNQNGSTWFGNNGNTIEDIVFVGATRNRQLMEILYSVAQRLTAEKKFPNSSSSQVKCA